MAGTDKRSDPENPSIAISYSRMMARQLHLQEKELGMLLRGTGLQVAELLSDDTLLSKAQQLQIMANAVAISRNQGFGLVLGEALTPPTHGPLGFLANSTPNLETAIRDFQSFLPGRVSFTHLKTSRKGPKFICSFEIDIPVEDMLYRCVLECFALSLISLIEFVLGKTFEEGQLFCRYPEPEYAEEYQRYIHCPIQFDARDSRLEIPESLLRIANVSADHVSYEYALQQCQRMLAEPAPSSRETTARVRRIFLSSPPGKLTEELIANLCFISKRTLARRLAAEGSSFREIREEILSDLARHYLKDTHFSVETIAAILNYYDSASFRRAFRRWHGVSPQEFRNTFEEAK